MADEFERRALQPIAQCLVFLRIITGLGAGADFDDAGRRRQLPEDEAEEQRFARAIGADETDAFAMPQREIQPGEDGGIAIEGHRQVLQLKRQFATARASQLQTHPPRIAHLLDDLAALLHALQHFAAAARLTDVAFIHHHAGPFFETGDGRLDAGDLLLLRDVGAFLPQARQLALGLVGGIVAGKIVSAPPVNSAISLAISSSR